MGSPECVKHILYSPEGDFFVVQDGALLEGGKLPEYDSEVEYYCHKRQNTFKAVYMKKIPHPPGGPLLQLYAGDRNMVVPFDSVCRNDTDGMEKGLEVYFYFEKQMRKGVFMRVLNVQSSSSSSQDPQETETQCSLVVQSPVLASHGKKRGSAPPTVSTNNKEPEKDPIGNEPANEPPPAKQAKSSDPKPTNDPPPAKQAKSSDPKPTTSQNPKGNTSSKPTGEDEELNDDENSDEEELRREEANEIVNENGDVVINDRRSYESYSWQIFKEGTTFTSGQKLVPFTYGLWAKDKTLDMAKDTATSPSLMVVMVLIALLKAEALMGATKSGRRYVPDPNDPTKRIVERVDPVHPLVLKAAKEFTAKHSLRRGLKKDPEIEKEGTDAYDDFHKTLHRAISMALSNKHRLKNLIAVYG